MRVYKPQEAVKEKRILQELQFSLSYVIYGDNFQGVVKWTW